MTKAHAKKKIKKKKATSKPAARKPTARKVSKSRPIPPPASTGYWLLKSEPSSYSIEGFARDKKTLWTGVRNYLARNFMMASMRPGDQFFFYQSSAEPTAIVGMGRITRVALPDPTAFDRNSEGFDPKSSQENPIWFCAEVEYEKTLTPITLTELKAHRELAKMVLLQKGSRLSIQPVQKSEFDFILTLVKDP